MTGHALRTSGAIGSLALVFSEFGESLGLVTDTAGQLHHLLGGAGTAGGLGVGRGAATGSICYWTSGQHEQ